MHFSAFVDLATEISAILPLWRLKLSVYFHLGEYYWKDFSSPEDICSIKFGYEDDNKRQRLAYVGRNVVEQNHWKTTYFNDARRKFRVQKTTVKKIVAMQGVPFLQRFLAPKIQCFNTLQFSFWAAIVSHRALPSEQLWIHYHQCWPLCTYRHQSGMVELWSKEDFHLFGYS